MLRRSSYITSYFLSGLFILCISGARPVFSQTNISGIINQYSKVESVGINNVTVADPAPFVVNDTVLLIQMSGGIIYESGSPGQLLDTIGAPGYYEFLIISNVSGNTITFTQNLKMNYNVRGRLQLIKTPSYNSAVVSSQLTCMTWDSTSGTGGVLAFIVKRHLTLNADISVTGKGFKGGTVSQSPGVCQATAGSLYFYDLTSTLSGLKGEGVGNKINDYSIDINPLYSKGKAPSFTGGGGANGRCSGGGGGSNYGAGGTGDLEISGCIPFSLRGGLGGFKIASTQVDGGVFMGGGGGASVYLSTPNVSRGGNGGGIIIIFTDSFTGNGHNITADGESSPDNSLTDAGAGGGGAAGSVIIQARSFSSNPVLMANGGNGGNTTNTSGGAGGGGGGGLIWTQGAFGGTATVSGGTSGLPTHSSNMDGSSGRIGFDLNLPLNGFLYNYVYSSSTLSLTDSICEGSVPPILTGTQPVGGTGSYTYLWERSTTSATTGFSPAPGTNTNLTYTAPAGLTTTTWYHRVVYSGTLTDVSKSVQIIVHPALTGNLVGIDTTICYNQDPSSLVPVTAIGGGHAPYYGYKWLQSPDNAAWSVAQGTNNSGSYDPAALTATRYYSRIVNSGACIDTSSSVTVTVLNVIGNNTIAPDQVICQGEAFADITGSAPDGGNNSYSYLWRSSPDNATWSNAPGVNNSINYNPTDDSPDTYYFQRIVMSGLHDCCVNTSSTATLVSHPAITNNNIATAQTICEGSSAALTGTLPAGGNGTYTYIWQRSPDNSSWSPVSGAVSQNFTGELLVSNTYYRRIVNSSACTNVSGSVLITVLPAILNYDIAQDISAHDTIRTGTSPAIIKGKSVSGGNGSYFYSWSYSTNNIDFTDLSVNTANHQPGILTSTTWFRRTVTSGACVESSTFKITVLPLITNNSITGNQHICNVSLPSVLAGANPSGGDGTYTYLWEKRDTVTDLWSAASGTNSSASYNPPYLECNTEFRRIVFSGENNCCLDTSLVVTVQIDIMPLYVTAGESDTLHPYQFAMSLNGGFRGTGTGTWSVISSDGDPVFENPEDSLTTVRKLGFGVNVFRWQVSNNTCIADPEEVSITVPEVIIPQAFSPNNDGLNDYFIVDGLEYTKNELVIINTGGAIVYKTNDYRSNDLQYAWNGIDNNGNPLPEGTYYFLLTVNGASDIGVPGYVAHISGFIIIRR